MSDGHRQIIYEQLQGPKMGIPCNPFICAYKLFLIKMQPVPHYLKPGFPRTSGKQISVPSDKPLFYVSLSLHLKHPK